MPDTCDLDSLMARIDEATEQIARAKDTLRRRHALNPDADQSELTTALEYWEECKREAEDELRRMWR